MKMTQMKSTLCTAAVCLGGWLSRLYGGWSAALGALICCMVADYITGLTVAGLFHASLKSKQGGLDSRVGWKGLAKKFVTLLIVLVAHQMDVLMATAYIRDAVIYGFAANEVLSILENAGQMGLPVPQALRKALDQLDEKPDHIP